MEFVRCRTLVLHLYCWLVLLLVTLSSAQGSPGLCSPADHVSLRWVISSDCSLDISQLQSQDVAKLRLEGSAAGYLSSVFLSNDGTVSGVAAATISNVILVSGSNLGNPTTLKDLLHPPLVSKSTAVDLTNVHLLYIVPMAKQAEAVAVLQAVASDLQVQEAVASWSLNMYTDNASYIYINSYTSGGFVCRGCGIYLQFEDSATHTSSAGKAVLGANYILGVDNDSFLPSLSRYGTIDTPEPFFMLLASNVSWGQQALQDPQGSRHAVARQVIIAGQQAIQTSIDLGMKSNALLLTAKHANITFDGVILENLGYGDQESGKQPSGLSLVNAFNVWFFYWDRQDIRIVFHNVTHVAPQQRQVEFMSYWGMLFGSTDSDFREQAQWLRRGPGVSVWEIAVASGDQLDVKFVARSQVAKNTWRSARQRVFPSLPMNHSDPELYAAPLKTSAAAPLTALALTNRTLQGVLESLSGLSRDGLAVVAAPLLSLAPDAGRNWPPASGITLSAPSTTIVGQDVCTALQQAASTSHHGSSSQWDSSSLPQQRLHAGVLGSEVEGVTDFQCQEAAAGDAAGGDVPRRSDSGRTRLLHAPMLDMGQVQNVVQLQPHSGPCRLELRALTLISLAQGPAVTAAAAAHADGSSSARRLLHMRETQDLRSGLQDVATIHGMQQAAVGTAVAHGSRHLQQASSKDTALTQAVPDVWTHLLWAVKRSNDASSGIAEVQLADVQLVLPRPEFAKLLAASRSSPDGSFTIPLTGSGGAQLNLKANISKFVDDCCLIIQNYTAPGLTAHNLLVSPDPNDARSMPAGYYWPYDGTEINIVQGMSTSLIHISSKGKQMPPAAIGGIVAGAVVGCIVLAALLMFVLRRKQRSNAASIKQPASADISRTWWQLYCGSRRSNYASGGPQQAQHLDSSTGVSSQAVSSGKHFVNAAAAGASLHVTAMAELQHEGVAQTAAQGMRVAQPEGGSDKSTPVDSTGGTYPVVDAHGMLSDKRWLKLTTAISGKVQDIHQNRLKAALLQSQAAAAVPASSSSHGSIAGREHGSSSTVQPCSDVTTGGVGSAGSDANCAGGAACGSFTAKQLVPSNFLQLKEVIGQGSFGVVYRATWQGVNVAVKLLQLPPSTRAQAEAMTAVWCQSGSYVYPSTSYPDEAYSKTKKGGLLKAEHMAVQEAAIGSTMMHPNIVAVYSITLRPSAPTVAVNSKAGAVPQTGKGSSSGVLILEHESGFACGGVAPPLAAEADAVGELLPWEMQLIMEYCDQGTLRQALDAGLLVDQAAGMHHLPTVLSLAHNVACAMQYLHQEHIIHGDLKASNVLLKTSIPVLTSSHSSLAASAAPRSGSLAHPYMQKLGSSGTPNAQSPTTGGVSVPLLPSAAVEDAFAVEGVPCDGTATASAVEEDTNGMHCLIKGGWVEAKVADFGLSLSIDPGETHVSSVHAGTLTHMAPEVLVQGRSSKASDAYSYGILLWELATGGKAFTGIPRLLLGHHIVSQQLRPDWPATMRAHPAWAGVIKLAEQCWSQQPLDRPTFAEVVQSLETMLRRRSSDAP